MAHETLSFRCGHPKTAENVKPSGGRQIRCRICARERDKRRRNDPELREYFRAQKTRHRSKRRRLRKIEKIEHKIALLRTALRDLEREAAALRDSDPFRETPKMTDSSVEAVARVERALEGYQDQNYWPTRNGVDLGVGDIRALIAALPSPEREPMREEWQPLRDLVDAARGLSHGVDWNNGTNAKLHGYRRKLLDALPGAEAALAALAPPPAQSGDRT